MEEKYYKIDNLSYGEHLVNVRGEDGKKRAMVVGSDGKIKKHAELTEVDPSTEFLTEKDTEKTKDLSLGIATAVAGIAALVHSQEDEEVLRDEQEEYEIELAIKRNEVNRETVKIEKERIRNRLNYQRESVALEAERQQNILEFEKQQMLLEKAAHDEKRRMRFENLLDDLEEEYLREEAQGYEVIVVEEENEINPVEFLNYVDVVLNKCSSGIASFEAQGQLLEIIEMSRQLALKIKQYAQTCINNGETVPDNYFEWQKAIERLVTQKVIEGLNAITSFDTLTIEQKQTYIHLLGDEQSVSEYDLLKRQIDKQQLGSFLFVKASGEMDKDAIKYCPNCGSKANKDQAYCMSCGAPLL